MTSEPPPAAALRGRPWLRCDPRARLLATASASGVVLAASEPGPLAAGIAAVCALHAASRTAPAAAFAALRPFRFLLLFTLVVQTAFTPGSALAPGLLPGWVTREGAQAAALALLRLAAVIAASAHLVGTTSPLELARSLGWAIGPLSAVGVRVREVTLVMALAFHFFPVLLDESRQVRAALESRGVSLRHPVLRLRARALLDWTLAVLFGMVDRSTRLAAALQARGFSLPSGGRQRFPPWRPESTAAVAGSLGLLLAAALLAAR